jgi:hypothetical protein
MSELLGNVTDLDNLGRAHMLGWLSSVLEFDPITRQDWQEAYGSAADDQTVRAARTALTQEVAS